MSNQPEGTGRTRRRIGLAMSLVAAVGLLVAIDSMTLDGLACACVPTDTQYAPGYSYWAFRSVGIGMTKDQVRALIGEPLSRNTMGLPREVWIYSRSPSDSHFRARVVIFERDRVAEVHAEFYFD